MLQKYYNYIKLLLQNKKSLDNIKKMIDTVYKRCQGKIGFYRRLLEMSGAIMEKVWGLLGVEPEQDRDDEMENVDYIETDNMQDIEEEEERKLWGRRNNKVVNMPQTNQVKMVICQPTTFEQSEDICTLLKEKKSIIVNLEYVNKDVARRIVDVVSGAVHALDGNLRKVSNSIFLVAPFNYDITNEMAREEIKNKLSVSWIRNNANN